MHNSITAERVERLVEADDHLGICLACGVEAHGVEPDARGYKCESCGAYKVYGAEELLFFVAG